MLPKIQVLSDEQIFREYSPPPAPPELCLLPKWMNVRVDEWNNEQVVQYLTFMNLDHLIPPFIDNGVNGMR